ncbi:hypothetical protein [Candidatus Clostridium radicumherbarum]|uniref:Uncharacterized protein n=1 Tax=Candidatus Clostridium radicumherbarum TaxID=3381662 RepID=A0ABW8TM09_9CLOT
MNNNKHLIANKIERKRVIYTLILLIIVIAALLFMIFSNIDIVTAINYRKLRSFRGLTGQIAAWGFGFSISMLVIRRIAKRINSKDIKMKLLSLARFTREWHVPISIIAFSVILLHAYIILSNGFILELRYISGLAALIVLGAQIISGIFRYKRKGIKFHMIMGISFIVLMVIHLMS